MKKWVLTAMVALAGVTALSSPCLAVSGAGAIALEFPIGARYNALGEAGVALSQDATASWWNPGGLAFLGDGGKTHDLHLMQSKLAAGLAPDIALYWLGYAGAMGRSGNLGVSFTYLDMGQQQGTDETGNPTGMFNSYMFAIGATYGTKLTPNVGVGIGAKYFRDRLAPDASLQDRKGGAGSSFALDAGVLWKIPKYRLNAALAVANLGPNIQHVDADQSDPLPRKLTGGLAYSVYNSDAMAVLVVADAQVPLLKWKPSKNDYGFGFNTDEKVFGYGVEWSYVQSLFVRLGYKDDKRGEIRDVTWGFGLDLERWTGQGITFGFAVVPQAKELDPVKRLSLGYRF
jgi:hypothetical protein